MRTRQFTHIKKRDNTKTERLKKTHFLYLITTDTLSNPINNFKRTHIPK